MNRIRMLPFLLALPLLFASCGASDGGGAEPAPGFSARQMAEAILSSQELPPMTAMTPEDEHFAARMESVYLLDGGAVGDGAVYYADGAEGDEIAVLELAEGAAPDAVKTALEAYIDGRASTFTGYFPEEAAMIENSAVAVRGDYAALLICEDPDGAGAVFSACFTDNPPALPPPAAPTEAVESTEAVEAIAQTAPDSRAAPTEPRTEESAATENTTEPATEPVTEPAPDVYDRAAVLAAWESGDWSGLAAKNRAVIELASEVIGTYLTDGMDDQEKELAIHDWIVEQTYYDPGELSTGPDAGPDPDSTNPYGLMINRLSICYGYSSTFQLFMDMLGIECITVNGTNRQGEEHAWNMVRLDDGEWYCVDVTWDDLSDSPSSANARISHAFYNATSAYLRDRDHVWDESAVPEATSDTYMTIPASGFSWG